MKLSMKISLIILMGLGVFAMVGSILKTVLLRSVGSSNDYTFTTSSLVIWWTVELYLVIIAASIPTLKPLLSKKQRNATPYNHGSYGLGTIGSRRTKGYYETHSDVESRYVTAYGLDDDNSSKDKILPEAHLDAPGDIRRTVKVSVDVHNTLPSNGDNI